MRFINLEDISTFTSSKLFFANKKPQKASESQHLRYAPEKMRLRRQAFPLEIGPFQVTCAIFFGQDTISCFQNVLIFLVFCIPQELIETTNKPLTFALFKKPWPPKSGVVRNCKWDRRSVRKTQEHPFFF